MTAFLWILLLGAALVIAVAALSTWGVRRWERTTRPWTAALEAGRVPGPALPMTRYDSRELEGLPEPVQRYFRTVLTEGQAIVSAVSIRVSGSFNLSATGDLWRPFESQQRVTTRRPGFLWDARIALLPGVKIHVVDSYIAGRGRLRASALGLFTMADVQGEGEIARGEFMRYFAESPWYPTALLPSQGVRWEAVDERSARASMTDGAQSLTLLFRFGDGGTIDSFRAEARGAMVDKVMVQAPWEGRFWNVQRRSGMGVPFAGEVAWMRLDGRRTYFRGAVTQVDYVFAP